MKPLKMASTFALACVVAGCSSTGVIPMDQDSYMIGKKDGAPGLGVSLKNKAAVHKEANEFCKKKGLEVQVLSENVTPAHPGRLGSTELQFRCVQPGARGRALVKAPDTVIQVNTPGQSDAYSELLKLDELRKKGIITEEEFQAEKAKLLGTK